MEMQRILFIITTTWLIILSACNRQSDSMQKKSDTDLNEIISRNSLVVATSNNSSDYFLYKGEPLGFQLELFEELGNYLGLKIDVMVCNDPVENMELLRSGQCDMVANSWNLSATNNDFVQTSVPLLNSDLLLVQRHPELLNFQNNKPLIKDIKGLKGKTIYVPILSVQAELMHQITDEVKNIQVVELPQYSQETLVKLVAKGDLDYTICNSLLAETFKSQYPFLDFGTVVKKSEPVAWKFRRSSPQLAEKINNWLLNYKKTTRYSLLLDKYFNQQNKLSVARNRYQSIKENGISSYDQLIKKYSAEISWDWRLLASLIYQESRFQPKVISHRGAYGLMQLMPSTRAFFGMDSAANPEQQIRTGVKYLKFLEKEFAERISDPQERIKFILASYNIGPGHIFDAQKLAEKAGKDPQKWFNNVDSCLLSKSKPENYRDPDILYGYCKGVETYNFVQDVMNRFNHYRNVIRN
jgi:membrane-bound lytic murein transglycosylase F